MPKKPARKPIPAPLQRCVTAVAPKMKAQGRGVGAAFAICTSQLQKSGVLKPGTRTVTHKGAGVISGIARRGEYRSTVREFERAITRKNGAHSEAEQIEEIVRLGTSPLKRDRTAYEKAVTRLWNRSGDDAASYNPAGGEADDVDLHDLYDANELPRVPRVGRVAVVRHRQGSTLEVGRRKYYWRWYIILRSY